ncbi:MAG: protein kinase [Sandaracinus sp.]|nr:protein kinase [Sandaracinus sp.]MCB9631877.1 protein kinase [Sandaracinus sp.]
MPATPYTTSSQDDDEVTLAFGHVTLDGVPIEGSPSGETLLDDALARATRPPEAEAERYVGRGVLGEGGMGEVRLYQDLQIGRQVAMKVMLPGRASEPSARARFLREAIIQGQLEHPSIVPVHEIGETASGDPYFTMKRIRGETLSDIVAAFRRGDAESIGRYPERRLLTGFAQACLAVDFAHSRGVVHRDLKPSNVMLGDFGEVYVLDWGVARVLGSSEGGVLDSELIPAVGTAVGTVLGTPGYIAPEQIRSSAEVDGRADVYALGAILFEILTRKALHRFDKPHVMLTETLAGTDPAARAKAVGAKVDPELMSLIVQATRLDPDERFQTARELHDAIQRYLDGHQQAERRRRMAAVHSVAARDAQRKAREGGRDANQWYRWAMREAGLALALDPQNQGALDVIMKLLVEPPKELPPEARKALARHRMKVSRVGARAIALARFSWALYVPLLIWMGIRSPGFAVLLFGFAFAAGFVQYWVASQTDSTQRMRRVAAFLNLLSIAPMTFAFGPFWMTPLIVLASLPSSILYLDGLGRRLAGVAASLAILVPAALEWSGVLPRSYVFEDGRLQVIPQMMSFESPLAVQITLVVLCLGAVFTSIRLVGGVRDQLEETEERLHRQAWQLQQLVPQPGDYEGSVTSSILDFDDDFLTMPGVGVTGTGAIVPPRRP